MYYKATVSFGGINVSMVAGETRELTGDLANDLLKAGYIIPIEPATKAEDKAEGAEEEPAKPKKKKSTTKK